MVRVNELHSLERKILPKLTSFTNWFTLSDAEKKTRFNADELRKALSLLVSHGLLKEKINLINQITLTKRGESVLTHGLPEDKLLNTLKNKVSINELREKTRLSKEEFNVSIGLLKKKGLINFTNGFVSMTSAGKSALKKENPLHSLLKKLPLPQESLSKQDTHLVSEAKTRGLVALETIKSRSYKLTTTANQIIKRLQKTRIIDELTQEVIVKGSWKKARFTKYDLVSPVPEYYPAKKQPYNDFLDWLKQKLVSLGFEEMRGPLVETMFWNCDALYMPQDHNARGIHDLYYVKNPKSNDSPRLTRFIKKVREAMKEKLVGVLVGGLVLTSALAAD